MIKQRGYKPIFVADVIVTLTAKFAYRITRKMYYVSLNFSFLLKRKFMKYN